MKKVSYLAAFLGGVAMVGCSNGGGGGGGDLFDALSVALNPGGGTPTISTLKGGPNADDSGPFDSGTNEGIIYDAAGNLYQAGDSPAELGIRAFCGFSERLDGAFDATRDRQITQPMNATLKGLAAGPGFLIASDLGNSTVVAYSTTAGSAAAPLGTLTPSGTPWDTFYDVENDRLYIALTNGTVDVVDDYAENDWAGTQTRTIIPTDFSGNPFAAPTNMHGVALAGDTLVLADVGAAGDNADGKLYLVEGASTADGNTQVSRIIAGDQTQLGNPVDILLADNGSTLIVAEKAQGKLLTFNNILNTGTAVENRAPSSSRDLTAPESVALSVEAGADPDVSDLNNQALSGVVVSTNAGLPDNGVIALYSATLGGTDTFSDSDATRFLESIKLDRNGDAYIGFDDNIGTGGLLIVNRITDRAGDMTDTASRDRIITGANTGLTSPKGLEIVGSQASIIVADQGAGDIKVFSLCADGDVAPLFTITDVGDANVWDSDYDPIADRLFVAGTNGTILVYDDFFANAGMSGGAADGPDRTIIPAANGVQISSNTHGIAYDRRTNKVIVSDVGAVTSEPNDDGAIFVINNASSADGLTNVSVNIGDGDTTTNIESDDGLANPVDIAFDGTNLYVAEKTKDRVYRFDNILTADNGPTSPNFSIQLTKPESVVLAPEFLD